MKIHFFDNVEETGIKFVKSLNKNFLYYRPLCAKKGRMYATSACKDAIDALNLIRRKGSTLVNMIHHCDARLYVTNDPNHVTCKHCLKKMRKKK